MNIVFVEPLEIPDVKFDSIRQLFEQKGHHVITYPDKPQTYDEFVNRMRQADIAVIVNIPLSKDVLDRCPKLKYLAIAFSGTDHVDLAYCNKKNIFVSNAAGYSTYAVAEITIGLMISVLRSLPSMEFNTRTMQNRMGFLGGELFDKTIGIAGTGLIGSRVAELVLAFGCKVLAWSRSENTTLKNKGITYVDKEILLEQSDILSLHLPLTEETLGFIGKEEIMKMKPSAVLINTARGRLVDEYALLVALKMGRIAGAGLDVYDREPPFPKEHPFRELKNTVLLPHIGYATREAMLRRADIVARNILKWLENQG